MQSVWRPRVCEELKCTTARDIVYMCVGVSVYDFKANLVPCDYSIRDLEKGLFL